MKEEDLFKLGLKQISLHRDDGKEWCNARLECDQLSKNHGLWFAVVPEDTKFGDAAGLQRPLTPERIEAIQWENGEISVKLPRKLIVQGDDSP